jgi:hypothetical protein
MDAQDFVSEQVVAGWLLILSAMIFLPAGLLYTGRAIRQWPRAQTQGYLYWERGLVIAAILVATMGFLLLTQRRESAGDRIVAPLAMLLILVSTVLVIAAEAFSLSGQQWISAAVSIFIFLSLLGQAAFGASILRSGFLPAWVGWVTVAWGLAWMIILPIARPQDMYYPWLHYVVPLLIGITLLLRG